MIYFPSEAAYKYQMVGTREGLWQLRDPGSSGWLEVKASPLQGHSKHAQLLCTSSMLLTHLPLLHPRVFYDSIPRPILYCMTRGRLSLA